MAGNSELIGKRYGLALFEVLESENHEQAEAYLSELKALGDALTTDLLLFFANPSFDHAEKQSVWEKIMEKLGLSESIKRFAKVLLDQKHIALLPLAVSSFDQALMEEDNKVEAKVFVALSPSEADKKNIRQALCDWTGHDVVMDIEVDASLIGGVKAQVGSMIYDASVSGQLERLVKEM